MVQIVASSSGGINLVVTIQGTTIDEVIDPTDPTDPTEPVIDPLVPLYKPNSVSNLTVVQDIDMVKLSWTIIDTTDIYATHFSHYLIQNMVRYITSGGDDWWTDVSKIYNINTDHIILNDLPKGVYRYYRIYTVSNKWGEIKESIPVYTSVVIPFSNPEMPTNMNYYTFKNGITIRGGISGDYSGDSDLDFYELELLVYPDRKWKEWPVEIKSLNSGQILR